MTYFDTWRTNLKTHLAEFAPLAKEDRAVNIIYGITAAAVLWGVRDAPFDDEQKSALKEAAGDDKHLPHLLRAVGGWDALTPLEAARSLSKRQRDSDELRDALTALMGTFIEELFEQNMVQHQHIDISGTISGGNIVIGGYQIVTGDMVIQHITQQKIRACPTAPKPPAHFAGRRDELNRLKEVLAQGQSVAITGIQGVGGIGKTALSLQLASEMSEFSAVLWASLGPNPNTGNQLIEWARHADPDFDPGQDDLDVLVSRVQALLTNLIQDECPGRVLVILDDIWEGDSVRAARTLQKAAPVNSVSLITTRSQRVVAQLRSTRLELQPMTPQDALQMLRNLLSDYSDIPDDALLELAEVVGYHPLAMELAAGQVTLLERPAQEIAEQIERYRGGIPAGSPFRDIGLELGEDREDNLEVVLAFSYDSLTETEQVQFRALGVLAYNAPFDREICRAIWEVNDPKTALDDLRHRALLSIAEDEGWYQQHVLLRSYARALLQHIAELDDVFNRYADHIIKRAEQFLELKQEQWLQLDPDLPHINYMGDELVHRYDTKPEETEEYMGNFATSIVSYILYRPQMVGEGENRRRRGLNWLEAGLNVYKAKERYNSEGNTLNNIGTVYSDLGDKPHALQYFNQALAILRSAGDKRSEATTLNNIGGVYDALGNKQQALQYYQQALLLRQAVGDKGGEGNTLNNIGTVYSDLGDKPHALQYFNQALAILRSAGDKRSEATTLNNIGGVYDALGDKQQALQYYNHSLSLRRIVGDKRGEATTLNNIGGVYDALGDKQDALQYYQQVLPIIRAVGDKRGEATTLNNIGLVYDAFGDKQHALQYYQQAVPMHREVGNRAMEATTLNNIGSVFSALGDKQQALQYYQQALPISQSVGDKRVTAAILNNIGDVFSALGDKQKSLQYFNQALPILRAVGDKRGEATTLNNIGLIYSDLGDKQQALQYYQQALPMHREVGNRNVEAITLNNIGQVFSASGDKQQALQYYQQALPMHREVGNRAMEGTTLNNIGVIYSDLGDKQQALQYYQQALPMHREVGNRNVEAITLNNIGGVYDALGDKQQALQYYQQALPIQRLVGDTRNEAITLNNIGFVWSALGEKHKALEFYEQALPILRAVGDRGSEATTLTNIGFVWSALGEKHKALEYYQQALPLRRAVGDRSGEALTCQYLALCCCLLRDYQAASPHITRTIKLQPDNTINLYWQAHVHMGLGNWRKAFRGLQADIAAADDAMTKAYDHLWLEVIRQRWTKSSIAAAVLDTARQHISTVTDEYSRLGLEALLSMVKQDISTARERYTEILKSERLKQNPFTPRFYLYQLATLFPEREAYREVYEWFSNEIRALYGLEPLYSKISGVSATKPDSAEDKDGNVERPGDDKRPFWKRLFNQE